jgi:hypothetical protein
MGMILCIPIKAVEAHVRLDIPLHFSSTNLTLVDTIYLQKDSLEEHNTVKSAVLKINSGK